MKWVMQLMLNFGLLSCLNLNSATNQEYFLSGNQLYQQAQFQAALTEYQTINPKSSVIWYNMGNCAYHLERYLEACLFWKRAQLLELKNLGYATHLARTCAQNLVQAQTKIITAGFKIVPKLATDFNNFNNNSVNNLSNSTSSKLNSLKISKFTSFYKFIIINIQQILIQIPLIIFQLLFLLSLILLFLVCVFKWGKLIKNILLVLFLNLILAASLYFKYNFMQQEWAIITKSNAALQIGPGENYPVVGHLKLAEFVKILGQNQQNWYAVQSEDGLQVGWTTVDGLTKC